MDEGNRAHELNVDGPFYVAKGCCTSCGIPEAFAPELFTYDSGLNCYVKRQPESFEELERALRVMFYQEFGCIRYRGADVAVILRLAAAGVIEECDFTPQGIDRSQRKIVEFSASAKTGRRGRALEMFSKYLAREYPSRKIRTKSAWWSPNKIAISWYKDSFHEINERRQGNKIRIAHYGPIVISEWIHEWLSCLVDVGDIRWFTEGEWKKGQPGERRPW